MLLSLFFIISLTFFMMKVIPGGPFSSEKRLPPEIEENINKKYHLNDPWYVQYKDYLIRTVKLDFGPSFKYKSRTVNEIIADGFPVSAKLGSTVILITLVVGINLGIVSAMKQNQTQDYFAMFLSTIGFSTPNFIIAYLLMYIFAYKLKLVPPAMWGTWKHMILPAISLAILPTAVVARLMRSSLIEELQQDYMLTAKAKGLMERQIIYRHALRNAIIPVITYLGPLIATIFTGSFIIEHIFAIPGLGKYFVSAIQNRDYTLILGTTVFYSLILMLMNLIVDILYTLIDPRVKLYK
ncbi:MAG: oligopeptide transport system permease protein [Clostridia bacterium]|jgi:oligopeptide transport system permease protein|nr:oligopeptide transport system permease protein [Clostridia bacterium]